MTLSALQTQESASFIGRHIGPTAADVATMLAVVGADSLDAFIDRVVPERLRDRTPLAVPPPCSEAQALHALRQIARRNQTLTSLIGMGYSGTVTPPVILRNVFEDPGWYTAYTPYQAEISQGRLEALLIFQQMICDLTGMEIANASLLDESTAVAEAMAMAHRVCTRKNADVFLADADAHPQTLAVLRTRAEPIGVTVRIVEWASESTDLERAFGALIQSPGTRGALRDLRPEIAALRAQGVVVTVAADLLALTLVTPPGEMGADIVVGSSQRFGVPIGYGGPHAAFFATRDAWKRQLPGRIIGVSVDAQGHPALRMALQTREQHIRREKATSNICTAQALLAIIAGFYGVWHGPEGLRRIAARTHRLAVILAAGLRALGRTVSPEAFFDTLTVAAPGQAAALVAVAQEKGVNLRLTDSDHIGISIDETTQPEHLRVVWEVFAAGWPLPDIDALDSETPDAIPPQLRRASAFLTHPVFQSGRSETEMLRYLRQLRDRDLALNRTMIPLGSCTMKLNATAEMLPVTWPEFSGLHPFAPKEQAAGYADLIQDLEQWLCAITGYDAASLQPNAGSQGEYAGLLAIRAWHRARGEGHRDVCLIPASAHGTNPASAAMAGMKVVVVRCKADGDVDEVDLRAKAKQYQDVLAALMITYPSTHGVFEEGISDLCAVIHRYGGQVYLDGANLNAMVGLVYPGRIGADVSHLNLHKTFCIPHGGGGPGVGPIVVRAHLAPYLPGHPLHAETGAVTAAPWGSAGILPITWMYLVMMGAQGLTAATKIAILNANYIAARLRTHYPVLYVGKNGFVAHECIVDLRPLSDKTGVSVEDVAKRLIDYGFHAPTMSFPVPGTLMIEPTESEPKSELDRFCDAMISIRQEIAAVESGAVTLDQSPLKNAPHPQTLLMAEAWPFSYSPRQAFFPSGPRGGIDKYWPPVARVDNVQGDRTLVCSCPPLADWAEA